VNNSYRHAGAEVGRRFTLHGIIALFSFCRA